MKKNYTFLIALLLVNLGFTQINPGESSINLVSNSPSNYNSMAVAAASDSNLQVAAQQNNELIFVRLRANTSSNSYPTAFYFNDNASVGFDFGYDAGIFGVTPNFALYSNLVEEDDNFDIDLSLQAVNTSDLVSVSFPLGLNASQGIPVTFSIIESTLPTNIEVYLDDTEANTSTLLNDSSYTFTPSTNLNGTGRFFLRTSGPSVTYTYDGTWSPNDPSGTATAGDDIVIASGDAVISSSTTCNDFTVNPGASVTIQSGATLTNIGPFVLQSTSTSYSSLILDGTVAGVMLYDRHVNINAAGGTTTGSNDLVSAPLTGQTFSDLAAGNPNILNNGSLYLFGPFEKNTGTFVTWADTETSTLDAGVGYRAATVDNDVVTFTGTAENGIITNDIVNAGTNNEEWNLVGNPYPSYLNVQQFLLHDVGGVTNIQLFDAPTAAIYGYDGSALNGWTVYNLSTTTPSTLIAPGQGFFVSADATNTGPYDLEFTPAMRSAGSSDDFIVGRNPELTYVSLNLNAGDKSYETDFYFNINATQGFDFGYDANIWGDSAPDFALYSHLVQDNVGDAVTLQALSMNELNDVTIPLGVNANQGEQLTFSIADMNIPASVNVYLEDVVANTVTLLNATDYVITPTSDLSGTGRFFLSTSNESLSTIDNSLDTLNIFALKASQELVVSGQLFDENTMLTLYDMQGRLVLNTELDNASLQNRIDVSNINAGVYIVTIQSNEQEKTKKVILN